MNEDEFLKAAGNAIYNSITSSLSNDYSGPVAECVNNVFKKHASRLEFVASSAMDEVISNSKFQESISKALTESLAKKMVSRIGGEFEKRINELKADPVTRAKITLPVTRAKITLATNRIIEEGE